MANFYKARFKNVKQGLDVDITEKAWVPQTTLAESHTQCVPTNLLNRERHMFHNGEIFRGKENEKDRQVIKKDLDVHTLLPKLHLERPGGCQDTSWPIQTLPLLGPERCGALTTQLTGGILHRKLFPNGKAYYQLALRKTLLRLPLDTNPSNQPFQLTRAEATEPTAGKGKWRNRGAGNCCLHDNSQMVSALKPVAFDLI